MLLADAFRDPLAVLVFLASLVIAVTVHECCHAFVADRLGDPTARHLGRVSLNPLAHLDPFGSVMLLVVGFGWGRPVPVDPRNFARPVTDELLVALAGPASNLVLAIIAGLVIRAVPGIAPLGAFFIYLNVSLACFNLLPVPPLDGSKLLQPIIGPDAFRDLERSGPMLLIGTVLALQLTPLGGWLAGAASTLAARIMGG